jgi:TonB family protein
MLKIILLGPGSGHGRLFASLKNRANFLRSFTLVLAMNRKTGILFLAVLLFQSAAAHAESVKDALNHKYKKQVLALRSPFISGDQKFDSAGQSLGPRPTATWLIYGGIYVEKLNLSSDNLRMEGPCAVFAGMKKGKLVLIRFSKSQRIEIHLDQPLNSLEDAEAVMGRVFLLGADAAQHAKPEFRRSDDNTPDDEIYHVKKDNVLPPRPTYTPEPEFSEEARRARFQGIVVLKIVINKEGNIVRVRLERALGMGLDQNAMEGVERWRFTPATRNGQPVAVEMNIEVAFNLY